MSNKCSKYSCVQISALNLIEIFKITIYSRIIQNTKLHFRKDITFPQIHLFQKWDIQQHRNCMLIFMALLTYCLFQQYVLFGVTRRHHCNISTSFISTTFSVWGSLAGIILFVFSPSRFGNATYQLRLVFSAASGRRSTSCHRRSSRK